MATPTNDQKTFPKKFINLSFINSFYLPSNKSKTTNIPKSAAEVQSVQIPTQPDKDTKLKCGLHNSHLPAFGKNNQNKEMTEIEKIEKAMNDTHLKTSKIVESQNKNLLIIMWICASPIARALQLLLRYFRGIVTMNDIFRYVNKPVIKIYLYLAVSLLLITLFIHRLLGAIIGLVIRSYLRKSIVSKNGRYDIHFGWVSYRGIFDLNQILIRDFMWRNPPEFQKTPYLIRCKTIAISFSLPVLIRMILTNFNKIELGEILIDSLEVYFERGHTTLTQNSLNAWAAVGAQDKLSEKNIFNKIVMAIWQAIVNRTKKNYIYRLTHCLNRPHLSTSAGEKGKGSASEQTELDSQSGFLFEEDLKPLHISNSDCCDVGDLVDVHADADSPSEGNEEAPVEKTKGGMAVWLMSTLHSMKTAFAPSNQQTNSDAQQNKNELQSQSTSNNKPPPLPTVEFDRLLVFDLIAHPLDLLSVTHVKRYELSRKSTIHIKLFHVDRSDITGKPKYENGPRVALPADDFGDKIGDLFAATLIQENPRSILMTLVASAITQILNPQSSSSSVKTNSKS